RPSPHFCVILNRSSPFVLSLSDAVVLTKDPSTTFIHTLSLPDALPIYADDEDAIGGSGVPPRPNGAPSAQAATGDDGLGPFRTRLGSLVLDTGRLTAEVDGEAVHLTPTELRVLLLLTEQPEHVYSREKIAFTVWGYEWAGDSRVVDVHIQRLRKKIGASMIETVRGFGYRFAG